MEIINAHVHMIELETMVKKDKDLALPGGISVLKDLEATLPLLSSDTLIAQMDEASIAKSVLFAVDGPIVYASNEYVHALCKKHPDRLLGFASVNPKDPESANKLEKAINGLGLKGLKLHPPLQNFFPDDETVFPLYEKAAELDIPVVFHVGTTPFGHLGRLSQANPILIDDVAIRFPNLRIMLTHLGTLWHNEAFMVVEKNPNVYLDTAAYLYEIRKLLTPDLIERIGPDKLIFGTDYPMPYAGHVHRMKDFVECIGGIDLPDDILKGIFKDNFERLLAGDKDKEQDISAAHMMEMLAQLQRN